MIIVSQNKDLVVETNYVRRGERLIFVSNGGEEELLVGKYATGERAQKVMFEIIDAMSRNKYTRHYRYDYDKIWATYEKPNCFEMPKE